MPIWRAYSPASIGKQFLRELNVKPLLEKQADFDKDILGYAATTYYGGRTECNYRLREVEVAYVDFLNTYPTIFVLQNLQSLLLAERIEVIDATERAKNLIEKLTLDSLFNLDFWWKNTKIICLVKPSDDLLPIRTTFDKAEKDYNTALCYLTSETPLWYCIADLYVSKLLTGKNPEIVRAIEFRGTGIQRDLKSVEMLGMQINPYRDNIFAELVEKRAKVKEEMKKYTEDSPDYQNLNATQRLLKVIGNSACYGIYLETNERRPTKAERRGRIKEEIYGLEKFTHDSTRDLWIEEYGEYYNPIIATFVTSGARLLLGLIDGMLLKHKKHPYMLDTDGACIPVEHIDELIEKFKKLNPYSFKQKSLLKLEDENFLNGIRKPLYYFGIASKRYCLFNRKGRDVLIRKSSEHGIGIYYGIKEYIDIIWREIVLSTRADYEATAEFAEIANYPLLIKFSASTPLLAQRASKFGINPFGFILKGAKMKVKEENREIQPIIPFTKDISRVFEFYDSSIDVESGETIPMESRYFKNIGILYFEFQLHPEKKAANGYRDGKMERRHIKVVGINYIGKEIKRFYLQASATNQPRVKKYKAIENFPIEHQMIITDDGEKVFIAVIKRRRNSRHISIKAKKEIEKLIVSENDIAAQILVEKERVSIVSALLYILYITAQILVEKGRVSIVGVLLCILLLIGKELAKHPANLSNFPLNLRG